MSQEFQFLFFASYSSLVYLTVAGWPIITTSGGTSFVTTAPMATTLFLPTVTPALNTASSPDYYSVLHHNSYHFRTHWVRIICKSRTGSNEYVFSDFCQGRNINRSFNSCIFSYFYIVVYVDK